MSAFEPHVVAVEWVGINSGLTGTMNQISGGMTNLARQQNSLGNQMGRTFGYWSQQMRIMRRSAEYMLAGFASYKVIQAFQNYRQFRSELGTLNTNLNEGQSQLNQWGKAAIDVSNRTATPVDQVVQSFQNLAASFPDVHASARRYLFPAMAEIEAKAANILGGTVEPQQFGSTILQVARSFYGAQSVEASVRRNPQHNKLERLTSQVITTLHQVPGTSGQALISYLPTLFQGAKSGDFSPEQALAMFTVAQRVMGRPAQTMQYLRQLQFRIKRPTPQAAAFLQSSGIISDPLQLYKMSGWDILQKILRHAATLPGGVSQKQLRQMAASGNLQGVHFTGEASQFLTQALGGKTGAGRMQSLFALQALSTGLPDLNKEVNKLTHHSQDLNQMFGKWLSQNALTKASNQMSNFSLTLINSFNPLINVLAKTAGHLADWATKVTRHLAAGAGYINRRTHGGLGYAADAGILYALRAGMPPGIGNALGRIPGVGRLLKPLFQMTGRERGFFGRFGRGAGEAGTVASEDAASGILGKAFSKAISGPLDISAMGSALGGQANGTPVAPFWVVIHPLSKATVPGLFGYGANSPTGLTQKIEKTAETQGKNLAVTFAKKAAEAEGISRIAGQGSLFSRVFRRGARGARSPEFDFSWMRDASVAGRFAGRLGPLAELLGITSIPFAAYDVATQPGNTLAKLSFGFGGSGSGLIHHAAARRGMVWTRIGNNEMARQVSSNSVLGRYLTATGGNIPHGLLPMVSAFNERKISQARVERAIMHYARSNLVSGALGHQMTSKQANAFYKYVDPIYNLGNRTRFIHQAQRQGGFEGYADLVVELQPAQELKDLVKPSQRKVHVRVPITNKPTQRGGRPTHRGK